MGGEIVWVRPYSDEQARRPPCDPRTSNDWPNKDRDGTAAGAARPECAVHVRATTRSVRTPSMTAVASSRCICFRAYPFELPKQFKASPFPNGATSNTFIYYIRCVHVTPVRVLIVAVLGRSFGGSLSTQTSCLTACVTRASRPTRRRCRHSYISVPAAAGRCVLVHPRERPGINSPDPALPCPTRRPTPAPESDCRWICRGTRGVTPCSPIQ